MGFKRSERAAVAGRVIARLGDPDFRRFVTETYGESPTFIPVLRSDSVGFFMKRLQETRPGAVIVVGDGAASFDLLTVELVAPADEHDHVNVRPESDMDMFLRYLATTPERSAVVVLPSEEDEVRLELATPSDFCAL